MSSIAKRSHNTPISFYTSSCIGTRESPFAYISLMAVCTLHQQNWWVDGLQGLKYLPSGPGQKKMPDPWVHPWLVSNIKTSYVQQTVNHTKMQREKKDWRSIPKHLQEFPQEGIKFMVRQAEWGGNPVRASFSSFKLSVLLIAPLFTFLCQWKHVVLTGRHFLIGGEGVHIHLCSFIKSPQPAKNKSKKFLKRSVVIKSLKKPLLCAISVCITQGQESTGSRWQRKCYNLTTIQKKLL